MSLMVLLPDQFSHIVSTQDSYSTETVKGSLLPATLLNVIKSFPLQCAFETAAVHRFAFRDESGERI